MEQIFYGTNITQLKKGDWRFLLFIPR